MGVEITPDGKAKFDTPEEAAAYMRALYGGQPPSQTTDTKIVKQPYGRVTPRARQNTLFTEPYKFRGTHRVVLDALKEAYPNGVTSQHLAQRIGKTMRSMPVIMVSLGSYAKKRGMIPEDLIARENQGSGMRGSIYKLTEKGLKEFFG